jgi:uncharacterized protein YqkB
VSLTNVAQNHLHDAVDTSLVFPFDDTTGRAEDISSVFTGISGRTVDEETGKHGIVRTNTTSVFSVHRDGASDRPPSLPDQVK